MMIIFIGEHDDNLMDLVLFSDKPMWTFQLHVKHFKTIDTPEKQL